MDYMPDVAALSMDLKAAEFSQQYAVSLQKKAMDLQEIAVEEIVEMMPNSGDVPAVPRGEFIDIYA